MRALALVVSIGAILQPACGKKGAPLPPLRVVPESIGQLDARQVGDRILLAFKRPAVRSDGSPLDPETTIDIHVTGEVPPPTDPIAIADGALASWSIPFSDWDRYSRDGRMIVPLGVGSIARALGLPESTQAIRGRRVAFVVEAVASPRRRSESSTISGLTICDPPKAPSTVRAEAIPEGMSLTWSFDAAAEGEVLIFRREPGGALPARPIGRSRSDATGFTDPAVPRGSTVEYSLRTERGAGCESGDGTSIRTTWLDTFPPEAPQGLAAVEEEGGIRLFWRPVRTSDASGYRVYRAGAADGAWALVTPEPVAMTTWTDVAAEKGVVYSYYVTAVDSALPPNESERSEPASAVLEETP